MALVWYIKKFNYAFLWHIMFYINFRTMLEKRNQTNDEKDVCIYMLIKRLYANGKKECKMCREIFVPTTDPNLI